MADEKKATMILEREYIVPLRRSFGNVARYLRAKKAMSALKIFVKKHMKTDDISIGQSANLEIWSQGIRNPPAKVTIVCRKYDTGKVRVEIKGAAFDDLDAKASESKKAPAKKAAPVVKDAEIVDAKADSKPASEEKPKATAKKAETKSE